jgi:hypothetical protein
VPRGQRDEALSLVRIISALVYILRLPDNRRLRRFLPTDCLTDSNELFFVVILVLSYLLVSLVPY